MRHLYVARQLLLNENNNERRTYCCFARVSACKQGSAYCTVQDYCSWLSTSGELTRAIVPLQ